MPALDLSTFIALLVIFIFLFFFMNSGFTSVKMATPPAPPMEGVTTLNDKGIMLIVLCFVFLFIGTLAVAMRLWARKYKHTSLAADDWWIVVALV